MYSFWGRVGFEQDLDGQGEQGTDEKVEERATRERTVEQWCGVEDV